MHASLHAQPHHDLHPFLCKKKNNNNNLKKKHKQKLKVRFIVALTLQSCQQYENNKSKLL
jgi:hypothetical protein